MSIFTSKRSGIKSAGKYLFKNDDLSMTIGERGDRGNEEEKKHLHSTRTAAWLP